MDFPKLCFSACLLSFLSLLPLHAFSLQIDTGATEVKPAGAASLGPKRGVSIPPATLCAAAMASIWTNGLIVTLPTIPVAGP